MTAMVDGIGRRVTFIEPPDPAPRLYALGMDPGCHRNVVAEHGPVAERLRREFVALLESSGVPAAQMRAFQEFAVAAG